MSYLTGRIRNMRLSDVSWMVYYPVRDSAMTEWYACEYPERPCEDGATAFHCVPKCRPCSVVADALIRQGHPDADALREYVLHGAEVC